MRAFALAAALLLPAAAGAAPGQAPTSLGHYAVTGSIAGPDGGWDLLAVDAGARRLLIARSTSLMTVDLRAGNHVGALGTVSRGHAAVPIPGTGRVLVTSGGDNRARIYETRSGRLTADVEVGHNPDASLWDARLRAVLVMNAEGGTVSVVDPARGRVTRTITLSPGLELAALDGNGLLYVNNEDDSLVHVVDPATGRVSAPIPLPGCEHPTGLGYDRVGHRLIAACANGKAAVVDTLRRRLVQLIDIGQGPDGVAVDAARGFAFIPCGRDGELDVIPLRGRGPLAVADRVRTEVGARTIALDPFTGNLYLPTARFGPPPAAGRRGPAIPGTFRVLVVSPPRR